MNSLLELFCDVDDFCQAFLPIWHRQLLSSGVIQRSLSMSEIMTILIAFHQSHYRDFKAYYYESVLKYGRSEFPGLVSSQRFVDFIPSALVPLAVYLRRCCLGECSGISFMDSTSLAVCHNTRIDQHKVFAGLAAHGKPSLDWSSGFKLHLVCNDRGKLLNVLLSPGNVDDRTPVPRLVKNLFGKIFADRGYLSQPLFDYLFQVFDIQLITKLRSNMQNLLLPLADRLLLRKRAIVETIIDQLKNLSH